MGELQEVLEAMFALINKMEMAIKINISIIFAIRDYFMWVTLNLTGKKKRRRGQPCEEILQHERVLRVLTLSRGASKDFFSLTFGLLPSESDKKQVSSPARALWVLDADYNVKYLCGNIITGRTANILSMATGHKGVTISATR